MLQFYVKGLYARTTNNKCLCLWLSMPARIETDYNLNKTEPSFSSLTLVCRHVIEHYMNRHFSVLRFPPAVVRHFRHYSGLAKYNSHCLRYSPDFFASVLGYVSSFPFLPYVKVS